MAHVPHLLLAGPWEADAVPLDRQTAHHLGTVLRRQPGEPVTYTDGSGTFGEGVLLDGAVRRGPERAVSAPPATVVAVAPPSARDRARFLVEKLGELGVAELRWIRTRHGEGRPPADDKVAMWCRSALEQSRGAWLMSVSGPVSLSDLPDGTVFADAEGDSAFVAGVPCVAVGPEGGWAPGEIPVGARTVSFGTSVLRVETAAIVAAVHVAGRPPGDHPEW